MAGLPLSDFIQTVKSGLARTNRFTVLIQDAKAELSLYCESVPLPGLSYGSNGVRSFGEKREVVYDRIFDAITLNFYVDSDMKVKFFFDEWMTKIVDPSTRSTNYYDEYTKTISIIVHDTANDDTYVVNLFEAFPKTVGAIQLDNNSKDIMKMSVTFEYRYHTNVPTGRALKTPTIPMTVETSQGYEDVSVTYEEENITILEGPGIGDGNSDTYWP